MKPQKTTILVMCIRAMDYLIKYMLEYTIICKVMSELDLKAMDFHGQDDRQLIYIKDNFAYTILSCFLVLVLFDQ